MTPLVQLLLPLILATLLLVSVNKTTPVSTPAQQQITPANPEVLAEQIPHALYSDRSSNQLSHL